MTTAAPVRARQSYRHEAFVWDNRRDYVARLVEFIRDGVEAGEAVIALLLPEHAAWVTPELGPIATQVHFVDMLDLGHNPARLIPALLEFLETSCGRGRPARGVGEPLWPGRTPEEVGECQLHEALLNLAVDPELPFWLLCPYDAAQLDAEVLAEVGRSHPALVTASSYEGSGSYRGHDHARALFTAALPTPPAAAAEVSVTRATLARAGEQVTLEAAPRLWSDQVVRLADVVRGLAEDGLRRGAEQVDVRVWDEPTELVCQISDDSVIEDFLVGRRPLPDLEEDALWTANQVCDLVQVRSGDVGTTVRLHVAK